MENQIHHEWRFNHSPDHVWKYLTDPILLEKWLMPNNFKLEIGHKFVFGTKPKRQFGFDGRIYGEVLEFEPNQLLKYSWRGGNAEEVTLDSVVTWRLESEGTGTRLILIHSGFRGIRNYLPFLIMRKGWRKIAQRLLKLMDA